MIDEGRRVFFSGIAGSGLSAIATFMADRGHAVVGSDRIFDRRPDHPLKRMLEARGIPIVSQDGNGVDGTIDLVVFSTAVEPDAPEIIRAKELGIPLTSRPDLLAHITDTFRTIAVSGTSGKSTVAGMLAFLMERLGLSPNFIGGGRVKQFQSLVNPGNSRTGYSDYLVMEACESDDGIAHYRPDSSVLLNLALDHRPVSDTARLFDHLVRNTRTRVILNADDGNLGILDQRDPITFSVRNPSIYRAERVTCRSFSTDFSLRGIRFTVSLPGEHNLYNALSCIALLAELGVSPEAVRSILPEFEGLERRFDVHLNDGRRLVVDDYAHNPHKISALMETVRGLKERVGYIFQPHGFGPTRLMKAGYAATFARNLREADHLILLPIFYAGGTVQREVSSEDLAEAVRAAGKSAEVVQERAAILERLDDFAAFVVFGARDDSLSDLARQIADRLR